MKHLIKRHIRFASLGLTNVVVLLNATSALGQGNGLAVPPPPTAPNNMTNAMPVNAAPVANGNVNSTDPTQQQAAGEPADNLVSLEYRNAPFLEVIRTLAEAANINVTLSSDVEKGSPVTIRLNKVTYEQALKAILEAYKFGSVFENGILKIDTLANLNEVRNEKLKQKESAWKVIPTKRLIWQVNYAKAIELTAILTDMLKAYKIDPRFSIVADKRTNKIIIEGIPDALVEAKGILENLDKRKQQVLIEARIVEASNELSKTLSVTWGTRFGLDGNRGLANGLIFPNSLTGSIGGAGALGASAPGPGLATSPTQLGSLQFTVGSINNLVNIDAVLRAYETESLANVIASPRVVVQDQEKAVINEDVTLSRSVLGANGQPAERNTVASLSLEVSPQVTSENTLELDIKVERQTPTNAPTDPVQGSIKRQANTKLIVSNGETAVIGGLYQTQKFKGQGRIPFLGRLPVIGALFRTSEEQSFRSELMVLITPRILPGGQSRSPARTDLSLIGGSNAAGGNFSGNGNGNNFANNSSGNGLNSNSNPANRGQPAIGAAPLSATNGAGGGANDFGDAEDFGGDLGNTGGGNATGANNLGGAGGNGGDFGAEGDAESFGGDNGTSGNNSGGNGGGNSTSGNFNNLGANQNSGGGNVPLNNGGGNAPSNNGGGNNFNNLNGGDL